MSALRGEIACGADGRGRDPGPSDASAGRNGQPGPAQGARAMCGRPGAPAGPAIAREPATGVASASTPSKSVVVGAKRRTAVTARTRRPGGGGCP